MPTYGEDNGEFRIEFNEREYLAHEAKASLVFKYKRTILRFDSEMEDEIVGYFSEIAVMSWLERSEKYCHHNSLAHITGPDIFVRPRDAGDHPTNGQGQWIIDVKCRRAAISNWIASRSTRSNCEPPTIYCWCSMEIPYVREPGIREWGEPPAKPSTWGCAFSSCVVRVHGWSWGRERVAATVDGFSCWQAGTRRCASDLLAILEACSQAAP